MHSLRFAIFLILLAAACGSCCAEEIDFSHDVLPILKENCAKCHTDGTYKGKLSIDTREALLESETALPGKSAESEFITRLTHADPDERMPKKADPLSKDEIAMLTRWINEGMAWEPGFTFKKSSWKAPLKPRRPTLPGPAKINPVDQIVGAYFKSNGIAAPPQAEDATFLRRIHLDLIGTLPTPAEVQTFLKSDDPEKRTKVAKDLLGRKGAYAAHWMTFWNDLLRNDYAGTGFIDGGRKQITDWLYDALRSNKPYDQFVRELIDPSADSEGFIKGIKWRGQVNASQVQEVQFAQNVTQVFLGENLKCASCHDSFINDWKLADAYGMAAIIAGKPIEMHRCDKPTGQMAKPKFLFPELGEITGSNPQERLKQTAALMTTEDNGRLTRTIANRLWQRLMGRGIIEPVDIMANEPWSPDLIDQLATELSDGGFDLKRLLLLITTSDAYAATTVEPHQGTPESFVFRGPLAKRMTAEQFIDAVWRITSTTPAKPDIKVPVELNLENDQRVPVQWIWSHKDFERAEGGETAIFRRNLKVIDEIPKNAAVILTCDNSYKLRVNGKQIAADDDWQNVEIHPIKKLLKPGPNQIEIEATNGTNSPNAAGLMVVIRYGPAYMPGDGLWQVTDKEQDDWKPATPIPGTTWGEDIRDQANRLVKAPNNSNLVRASLLKSNLLMRALGRPNREQVVTTRPAELSTLQALELNNGRDFVAIVEKGAKNRPDLSPVQLYREALGRVPSAQEKQIAEKIAETQGIADLLWVTFMLPEFQIIR